MLPLQMFRVPYVNYYLCGLALLTLSISGGAKRRALHVVVRRTTLFWRHT